MTDIDAPPPLALNSPRHIVAVAGVVRDGAGRVLLVHSPVRGWEPPGGHVEIGEDLITALEREVAEETGCAVAVERLLGIYSFCDRPYFAMVIFACAYLSGEPTGSDEAPNVAWFDPQEAARVISPPPIHAPVADLIASGGQPMYRAYQNEVEVVCHDGFATTGTGATPTLTRLESEQDRHIVAVSGCIRDAAGRVLLVRSDWRGWELPGGQVEQGEDLIIALRREIEEESGCSVAVGRLRGIYCNVGVPYIVIFSFAGTYLSGDLRPSDETPEVAWFTPEEALALQVRSVMQARIRDALDPSPGIAYRVYRTRPAYEHIAEWRLPA